MRALVFAGFVVFAPLAAWAQESGGSFGGGDFGGGGGGGGGGGFGGGGGGGGGWSGGGYGGSSDWGSGTYVGTGGGGDAVGTVVGLVFLLVIFGVAAAVRSAARAGAARGPGRAYRGYGHAPALSYGSMHLSQLQLGIDWHARRDLQGTFARLAASGKTGSREGRAELLRETVLAIRRAEVSWLYVGFREQTGYRPQEAEGVFRLAANDARARFRREVIRDAGGQVSQQAASGMQARSDEGEGVVVVTLVLATWRIVRAPGGAHAGEIRAALDNRAALTPAELAAIEVVWSPAVEEDRMSSAELEQFYPEMVKIDPASIAGRVFCEFCKGPFAMELLQCPHCGAQVRRS